MPFNLRKPFLASFMAAAVQRKAIEGELQRFTLRVTRRTVPVIFSMKWVKASERRNSAGRPSLLTVRISSNPSRMLFETLGASRSRRWAAAKQNRSKLADISSQALPTAPVECCTQDVIGRRAGPGESKSVSNRVEVNADAA